MDSTRNDARIGADDKNDERKQKLRGSHAFKVEDLRIYGEHAGSAEVGQPSDAEKRNRMRATLRVCNEFGWGTFDTETQRAKPSTLATVDAFCAQLQDGMDGSGSGSLYSDIPLPQFMFECCATHTMTSSSSDVVPFLEDEPEIYGLSCAVTTEKNEVHKDCDSGASGDSDGWLVVCVADATEDSVVKE